MSRATCPTLPDRGATTERPIPTHTCRLDAVMVGGVGTFNGVIELPCKACEAEPGETAPHYHYPEPDLGPLATAYVLILAVAGPVIARASEPLRTGLRRPLTALAGRRSARPPADVWRPREP